MQKIIVDEGLCIGCGACVSIDGEHFDFNDKNIAICISNENIESPALKEAINACPTSAIKIAESSECECEPVCTCENCECN